MLLFLLFALCPCSLAWEAELPGDAFVLAFLLFSFCSLAWEAELPGDALVLAFCSLPLLFSLGSGASRRCSCSCFFALLPLLERKLHDGVMTRLPARRLPLML
jgi:hypothetical protein